MNSKTILGLLGLLMLMSCEEDHLTISVGDNFIKSETTVALVDSMTVNMSSFKIDSIATSSCGYLLAGKYSDPFFGEVRCTGYCQLDLPSYTSIDDDEVLDSICIELPYSGTSYGDTLTLQTIKIHRVLEDIEATDIDASYIYNTSSFKYDTQALGEKSWNPRPNQNDKLEVRLSDELGADFMNMLKDNNDGIDITSDFVDYFKGVAVVSGSENTALLSFVADTSLKIVLYTHLIEEEKIEKSYIFPYASSLEQFNNISSDVSGFSIEALSTQRENISSGAMADMAYLQAGTAIVTRLDFPSLSRIFEVENKNYLYKAELVLRPITEIPRPVPLPESLTLYTTDKYNNFVSQITDTNGDAVYATFYHDEFFNEDTYYVFDITNYLYSELSGNYVDPNNGLLVMFGSSEFYGTVNRVVFDARSGSSYRPYLNLYYIFYN
ncbi:DUF4270 family protein [Prolixibacteraceae bacterium Z1-6]|uniref:DUF4270 family protein n=1 Tax=Draconibacterium aestuarii TaxID=2998507 RepID=A0A9X3F983_9BACT|nr:DUF4270 family protein [Prolixibacteraceae bacterium Z1-6]